jgi:hypothetical protein
LAINLYMYKIFIMCFAVQPQAFTCYPPFHF